MATNPGTALDTKEVISVLNGLIETCKDGEEGFHTAAEKVKDPSLKATFSNYSTERATFARELQSAVTGLGGDPATSGHVIATLHRGWINLKEALAKNEDTAIIKECEAGEDAAMKNYRDALAKPLPVSVSQLVQQQFAGVQATHNAVRDLKHSRQQ
jgi:uncharacterized protein (TIGR02284 family)